MRSIDQYPTIRKGVVEIRRQEVELTRARIASLRRYWREQPVRLAAHWLGQRLITWGTLLVRYSESASEHSVQPESS